MPIIQQESLFSIDKLYVMEPPKRYDAINSVIDIDSIPLIIDVVKRLNEDIAFKINFGFLVSNHIPSQASYSRLITKLSDSHCIKENQ